MKTITLVLSLLALTTSAQVDSLTIRIRALETEQERIKGELWRSHEKFRLGAIITGVGLLLCGYEAVTWEQNVDNDTEDVRTPMFAYIGSGLMVLGGVVMVDSHRHIGLAGRTKNKPKTWRPANFKRKKK